MRRQLTTENHRREVGSLVRFPGGVAPRFGCLQENDCHLTLIPDFPLYWRPPFAQRKILIFILLTPAKRQEEEMERMTRKPNLFIGATLARAHDRAGGRRQWMLERSAVARGDRPCVEAPMFEVDPFWPKPLPNHWIMGSTIGVSVDSRDHVWVIHRRDHLRRANRDRRHTRPSGQRVLHPCTEHPRVRSGGQPGELLRRSGRRVRLADIEPRDLGRPQGQRLDRW